MNTTNDTKNGNGVNAREELKEAGVVSFEPAMTSLAGSPVKESGRWLIYHCPFPEHGKRRGDKNPSFSFDPETGTWRCFAGCGVSEPGRGDIIELYQALEGLTFEEAKEAVAQACGVSLRRQRRNVQASFLCLEENPPKKQGLTLEEYANYVGLPVEFLKELKLEERDGEILIPYLDVSGELVATRRRLSLEGERRFAWNKGAKPTLYGLWRLKDQKEATFLFLVEGESDSQVAWFNCLPCLGVPGASSFKEDWWKLILDALPFLEEILIVQEPGNGGETFVEKILESKPRRISAKVISLGEYKDFREVWKSVKGDGEPEDIRIKEEFKEIVFEAKTVKERPGWKAFCSLAEIEEIIGQIEWLWPGWIPKGMVSLLVGQPSVGKSIFALHLCRAVIKGLPWLGGYKPEEKAQAGKAVWVDMEHILRVLIERAKRFGIEKEILIPRLPVEDRLGWYIPSPETEEGYSVLEEICVRCKPNLIVIDSLGGAFQGDENSKKETAQFLKKLSVLADRYNVALVLIHHLRKKSPFSPSSSVDLDKIRGSSSIAQFVRSVIWLDKPDPRQPDVVRVVQAKPLDKRPESFGFRIIDGELSFGEAPEAPSERKEPSRMEQAIEFLKDFLSNGEKPSKEVYEAGKEAGFAKRTLKRAKEKLGITAEKQGSQWYWKLPQLEEEDF